MSGRRRASGASGGALIGVEDLEPPQWADVDQEVARANLWEAVRELPWPQSGWSGWRTGLPPV
ncbi:hypothetical protein EIL87_12225 [Saccharopolyspora rhizosphaerae]|uniref:Uncharacterized protein n=1 Tax=Saccharopolyspora rhizosphaerae TaxID=2492662 RepID=A0A3R8QB43_9PSEU|nr:hypothetical protein [Saccharopolyspora rhizosphaerae]RRO17034.1 hypothetical protein EIL87_12225 [Saccharopolyspora rhizosphaerae]